MVNIFFHGVLLFVLASGILVFPHAEAEEAENEEPGPTHRGRALREGAAHRQTRGQERLCGRPQAHCRSVRATLRGRVSAAELVSAPSTLTRLKPAEPVLLTGVELAEPLEPRAWVSEWLGVAPGRPTILCGEGGSRKGWLSMAMLLLGAADRDLFGHRFSHGMRGVYFDWEQTLYETKKRFQLLARGYGIDLRSLGTRLGYMWIPVGSLAKETARDDMCRRVEGFDLAVVDSTRASTVGVKENSEEASYAGQTLTTVSEKTACSFIMLDHTGLPDAMGQRQRQHAIRGHSSKRDISSTLLVMSTKKSEATLVTCERCQGKAQEDWAEPFKFALARTQNDGITLVDCPVDAEASEDDFDDRVAKVLACIEKNPGIAGAVAVAHHKSVKMREAEVRSIVQMLETEGRLTRVKSGGVGQGAKLYLAGQFSADSAPF